ncbi:1684_t:CDS:2 [Diversispora eburnea]|uniref:1684_t:CDS:1 n=1 Tax=Diversispora eburnea TaxID=1213867 RepID=A0A9N9A7N0_9GLOM|nr:1684_t:CDS:2 [Diversispora eburnea]
MVLGVLSQFIRSIDAQESLYPTTTVIGSDTYTPPIGQPTIPIPTPGQPTPEFSTEQSTPGFPTEPTQPVGQTTQPIVQSTISTTFESYEISISISSTPSIFSEIIPSGSTSLYQGISTTSSIPLTSSDPSLITSTTSENAGELSPSSCVDSINYYCDINTSFCVEKQDDNSSCSADYICRTNSTCENFICIPLFSKGSILGLLIILGIVFLAHRFLVKRKSEIENRKNTRNFYSIDEPEPEKTIYPFVARSNSFSNVNSPSNPSNISESPVYRSGAINNYQDLTRVPAVNIPTLDTINENVYMSDNIRNPPTIFLSQDTIFSQIPGKNALRDSKDSNSSSESSNTKTSWTCSLYSTFSTDSFQLENNRTSSIHLTESMKNALMEARSKEKNGKYEKNEIIESREKKNENITTTIHNEEMNDQEQLERSSSLRSVIKLNAPIFNNLSKRQ